MDACSQPEALSTCCTSGGSDFTSMEMIGILMAVPTRLAMRHSTPLALLFLAKGELK